MFTLYISRTESKIILKAMEELSQYKDNIDLKKHLQKKEINCNLSTHDVSKKHYPDIERDIATTLCRLINDCPITKKSDKIWKTPPTDWNSNHKYYSPCNAGKRREEGQDKQLVTNSITYCEIIQRDFPPELKPIINAWKTGNKEEICMQYTIWANVCIIDHSLKYLEVEGYLDTPQVQQCLDKLGITRITTTTDKRDLGKVPSKQSLSEQPRTSTINQVSSTRSYSKKYLQDKDVSTPQKPGTSSLPGSTEGSIFISTNQDGESKILQKPTRKPVKRKRIPTTNHEPAKKAAKHQIQELDNDEPVKSNSSKNINPVLHTDPSKHAKGKSILQNDEQSKYSKPEDSSRESAIPDISVFDFEADIDAVDNTDGSYNIENDEDLKKYFETDDFSKLLNSALYADKTGTRYSHLQKYFVHSEHVNS